MLQRRLLALNVKLRIVVLEHAPSHLRHRAVGNAGIGRVASDGFAIPFHDDSFDLVACSLVIHHLEPDEVARLVNESLRVCRQALLINDLRRSALHLALVYAGMPLYRARLTRHDAPISVRRAYTINELRTILQRTRTWRIEFYKHYLFRIGAIAWEKACP